MNPTEKRKDNEAERLRRLRDVKRKGDASSGLMLLYQWKHHTLKDLKLRNERASDECQPLINLERELHPDDYREVKQIYQNAIDSALGRAIDYLEDMLNPAEQVCVDEDKYDV